MPLPATQQRPVRRAKIIPFPAPPAPSIQAKKREISEWIYWALLIVLAAVLGEFLSFQVHQPERQTASHTLIHPGIK